MQSDSEIRPSVTMHTSKLGALERNQSWLILRLADKPPCVPETPPRRKFLFSRQRALTFAKKIYDTAAMTRNNRRQVGGSRCVSGQLWVD